MTDGAKSSEVRRILLRYMVEVVEKHDLCPWARRAREDGELAIEIVWSTPHVDAFVAAAERALASSAVRVAMIVAPELACAPAELRAIRDAAAARMPAAGVADFHPRGAADLATAARAVPFLRRSPDPLLQLVPLALLESVRRSPLPPGRTQQAQILAGTAQPPRAAVADAIAAANHATALAHRAAIEAALDSIAVDRDAAYARVGIARRSPETARGRSRAITARSARMPRPTRHRYASRGGDVARR
jgi:hypothetical protein